MASQTKLTKKRLVLFGSGIIILALIIGGAALLYQSKQKATKTAELTTTIAQLQQAYDAPIADDKKLSTMPEAEQTAFRTQASEYFGVTSSEGEGTPAPDAQIVGACMRSRNLDLAGSMRDIPADVIMERDNEIKAVRHAIAEDCYKRYSADGKLPDQFSESIHNH